MLCLHPSASVGVALSSPLGAFRAATSAAAELEALALRSRGARPRVVGPDREAAAVMGGNFMDPRAAEGARTRRATARAGPSALPRNVRRAA